MLRKPHSAAHLELRGTWPVWPCPGLGAGSGDVVAPCLSVEPLRGSGGRRLWLQLAGHQPFRVDGPWAALLSHLRCVSGVTQSLGSFWLQRGGPRGLTWQSTHPATHGPGRKWQSQVLNAEPPHPVLSSSLPLDSTSWEIDHTHLLRHGLKSQLVSQHPLRRCPGPWLPVDP